MVFWPDAEIRHFIDHLQFLLSSLRTDILLFHDLAPAGALGRDEVCEVLRRALADDIALRRDALGKVRLLQRLVDGFIELRDDGRRRALGYTPGGFNDSILTMVPNIQKASWDPLQDFAPISLFGTIEWGLVVRQDSPLRTAADFIQGAKVKPGAVNFGSGSNGSPQHLAMALFANRAGIDVMHVPYKGATPAAVAVAAGEVDVGFQGLGTVTSLLSAGKLRLLAVSSPQRLAIYPDAPTVAESGLNNYMFNSWIAMVAPKGTSSSIVEKLHIAVKQGLNDDSVRKQLVAQGVTLRGSTPAEFEAALKDQHALYKRLIQANNIRAD